MKQVPEKEVAQGLSSLPQGVCGHYLNHSCLILSHSPGKENPDFTSSPPLKASTGWPYLLIFLK